MSAFKDARKRLGPRFETALAQTADAWGFPAPLGPACRHSLFGGGKRVRPLLALMGAEAVGGQLDSAMPWAIAVEMIHTYSLVHDDLPSMDDDDTRRGRPTCHIVYGEAMAILAGDALLTQAFAHLAAAQLSPDVQQALFARLAAAAGGAGMVGGQVLDIGDSLTSLDALIHMQRLKTGALIQGALVGGAIAAGATASQITTLEGVGADLGLLFQITDDLLDAEQDAERNGCSFLQHLSHDEVISHRDTVAERARAALATEFGAASAALVGLTDFIVERTV